MKKSKILLVVLIVIALPCALILLTSCELNELEKARDGLETFKTVIWSIAAFLSFVGIVLAYIAYRRSKRNEKRLDNQKITLNAVNVKRYKALSKKLKATESESERNSIKADMKAIKDDRYLVMTLEKRLARAEQLIEDLSKQLKMTNDKEK